MFVKKILLFVLVGMILGTSAHADFKKTKIAVVDFSLQGENFETEDMGKIVAEWFITALVKVGRFEVVERSMLQKIIEEQKLALSGLVDASTATQLGKVLGVKIVITGSVMKLQNITEINARIIDVESASIITAESVRSSSTTSLQQLVVQMSEKIIKNFPLEGYVVKRSGKKVTIDLGRRAGVKQGMEFSVYREGSIIKHPRTGEVLDVEQIETGRVKIDSVLGKISQATIVEEKEEKSINYGQLVKSIRGPLTPIPEPVVAKSAPRPKPKAVAKPRPAPKKPAAPALSATARKYIQQLESGDAAQQRDAAKRIARARLYDTPVLAAVEKALLNGYQDNTRSNIHVDAMAWLCKVLGASGNAEYRQTLNTVAQNTKNRKLRGYAQKSLARL